MCRPEKSCFVTGLTTADLGSEASRHWCITNAHIWPAKRSSTAFQELFDLDPACINDERNTLRWHPSIERLFDACWLTMVSCQEGPPGFAMSTACWPDASACKDAKLRGCSGRPQLEDKLPPGVTWGAIPAEWRKPDRAPDEFVTFRDLDGWRLRASSKTGVVLLSQRIVARMATIALTYASNPSNHGPGAAARSSALLRHASTCISPGATRCQAENRTLCSNWLEDAGL